MRARGRMRRRYDGAAKDACQVFSISPATGGTAGGTSITVRGRGFVAISSVRLSGVNCTDVVLVDSQTITCVTGATTAGAKTCRVTQADGRFRDRLVAFTYV